MLTSPRLHCNSFQYLCPFSGTQEMKFSRLVDSLPSEDNYFLQYFSQKVNQISVSVLYLSLHLQMFVLDCTKIKLNFLLQDKSRV